VPRGGRPVIIFGGISAMGSGRARAGQCGIDVAQIYRAANNKLVDGMVARFRGAGSEFIPKGRVARAGHWPH